MSERKEEAKLEEKTMKWSKRFFLGFFVVIFTLSFMVPTAFSYKLPLKQKSFIELNYPSFDENSTAQVNIEFSGEVDEGDSYYELFFPLLGVWLGYRPVMFSKITLQIDNYNATKDASFDVVLLPNPNIQTFFVTINTTFEVPLNSLNPSAVTNGTIPFKASYEFMIYLCAHTFKDKMTGIATILVNGVTVDENLPFVVILSITAMSLICQRFYKKEKDKMKV
jgi:hypothetical protein